MSIYLQIADEIWPIYGVRSLAEAEEHVEAYEVPYLVETDEGVYMNPHTGSLGFASDWDDLHEVVPVDYDIDELRWIEI